MSEIMLFCINYYPLWNSAEDFFKPGLGRFLWAGLLCLGETMGDSSQRGALGVFLSQRGLVSKKGDKRTPCQPCDFLLLTFSLKSKPSTSGLCWTWKGQPFGAILTEGWSACWNLSRGAYMISQLMQGIKTSFIPVGHWCHCALTSAPRGKPTVQDPFVSVIKPKVMLYSVEEFSLIPPKAHHETRALWRMAKKRKKGMKAFICTWHTHESRSIFISRRRPFLTSL